MDAVAAAAAAPMLGDADNVPVRFIPGADVNDPAVPGRFMPMVSRPMEVCWATRPPVLRPMLPLDDCAIRVPPRVPIGTAPPVAAPKIRCACSMAAIFTICTNCSWNMLIVFAICSCSAPFSCSALAYGKRGRSTLRRVFFVSGLAGHVLVCLTHIACL
ncbi:hypothetical protein Vretifemale_9469 [Volvox reticuliferus]|uniref:Uncharacterized protein n=1 Tax=Volvox reticuliferus TaxID=1737510 RepID=A0A8J4CES3_9CHLO|nr:hypothetical protein Vretifemale_9469 [Volvox reticuliferus]